MKTNKNKQTKKADYGQDMPGIIVASSILAVALLALAVWQYTKFSINQIDRNLTVSIILAFIACLFLVIAVVGIWTSRYGKLLLRDKVLRELRFKGTETILDLGCGRGLLLIEAAKKIPEGKAIGADLWLGNLEYRNSPQMVLDNAKIEQVSDRVEVITADAENMPFTENSFDMVMTSLMMHHVHDTNKALSEMFRVLKPGGTLVIADVNSKRFVPLFQSLGLNQVKIHYSTRLLFIPAYVVIGKKSV
jgi:arsenite methyltransferase